MEYSELEPKWLRSVWWWWLWLLWVVFHAAFNNAFISTSSEHYWQTPVPSHLGVKLLATLAPLEPSSTHNCERSELEKLALNSGTTGGGAKNDAKCVEKALRRNHKQQCRKWSPLLCCTTGNVHHQRRKLGTSTEQTSLHDLRDVRTVDELRQNIDHASVVAHNGRVNDRVQDKTGCNCGISTVSSRRTPVLQDLHNHDDHRITARDKKTSSAP